MKSILLFVAACIVLVGAGCWTTPPSPAPDTTTDGDSGVRGTALIGPTCPVERDPPDPACADRPYQGSFVVETTAGARVASFSTAADGSYSVALDPGTYVIELAAPAFLPSMSPVTVTVVEDAYATLDLSLDSGIR